ncbi:hypothetical protein [Paenibacillus sp. 481]|uniref:hypothetical protein n=1 Tax=Paenibacillus sp. 481 TaxID=2835869 RepID=UPI001E33E2A7|nr:hypothetical protein [Paenibacillus sp. 481]UHA72284.1 hypothetical protein KIK04_16550 [Paenibacillus sp. 481]
MFKHNDGRTIPAGSYQPILPVAEAREFGWMIIPLEEGKRFGFEFSIQWRKRLGADLGELEIVIHRGAANGPVVHRTIETCYLQSTAYLEFEEVATTTGPEVFYFSFASKRLSAEVYGTLGLRGYVKS